MSTFENTHTYTHTYEKQQIDQQPTTINQQNSANTPITSVITKRSQF